MKIEIWSDYVCPFCYIGKRRLEQALENLSLNTEIEIDYKSFELDPEAPMNTGLTIEEKLAHKYGKSIEEAKEMPKNMSQQAIEAGLNFQLNHMIPTNTFKAHMVAKLAEKRGLKNELTEKLFQSVFTSGKDIGDTKTLLEIAGEVGLEADEVLEVLTNNTYGETVRQEEAEAYEIGVQGVPFYVINRKYAISGAQPPEVFVKSLKKVIEGEHSS
ncbi:DsbA family oxidoreductase [Halobacillus andaensis]|nr:DsbA family oxidoreductase [Halobacillus andaensis]MBP2005356.1 putative DsbA family dithiol-disulfide isomerase [Halobacillus andaensis]